MELLTLVETTSMVLGIALMFTGVPTFVGIVKRGNTRDVAAIPFLVGLFNLALFLVYGYLINNPMFIGVCGFGTALHFGYMLIYYLYCSENKNQLIQQIFITLSSLLAILFYTFYIAADSAETMGLITCVGGILFAASPLSELGTVIRTKSTATLPFGMIAGGLVMGALNWLYGVLLDNNYIVIPNVVGTFLNTISISLYFIYPSKKEHQL